jgi:hypothetical protein
VEDIRDKTFTVESGHDLSEKEDFREKMLNKLDCRVHDDSSFTSLEDGKVESFLERKLGSLLTELEVDSWIFSGLSTGVVIMITSVYLAERRPVDEESEELSEELKRVTPVRPFNAKTDTTRRRKLTWKSLSVVMHND